MARILSYSFVTDNKGISDEAVRIYGIIRGMKMVAAICALGREDVYRWVLGLQVHAGRVIGGVTNTLFGVEHDQQLNVVAITDPLGRRAETYRLDGNERIVRVTNLEGQTMFRAYAVGDQNHIIQNWKICRMERCRNFQDKMGIWAFALNK